MFNHCVIVISLWNFECLIQRVFLYCYAHEYKYFLRLPFSGCKWLNSIQKKIYFWYGNFRYEDFNYLFQDLFEKGVVNTFI